MTPFDKRFEEALGPEAARALQEWSARMGIDLTWGRLFVNGRSTATVLAAYENVPGHGARKVVLKYDPLGELFSGGGEFSRHREALASAGAFRPHLADHVHDPIRVGDGTWITVQEYADAGLTGAHVLTAVLAATPGVRLPDVHTDEVTAGVDDLGRICARVCSSILTNWAGHARIERQAISDVLRRHLGDRAQPGKGVARLASRWPGRRIRLPGEPEELPNPFALVLDPSPQVDVEATIIVGPGHGDLHTENVIVSRDGSTFWLIDLARHRPDAPLTQDPVQLLLAIVNRTLALLTPQQAETLLRVLSDDTAPGLESLPAWLSSVIGGIAEVCQRFIGGSGLGEEWRAATTLSTVACALIFAARPSTSQKNRVWLLRLAARSAARALGVTVQNTDPDVSRPAPAEPPDRGLALLCGHYPELAAAGPSHAPTLDTLTRQGRAGADIRDDLARFAQECGVQLDVTYRGELGGLAGYASPGERFGCPLETAPCQRVMRRTPGSAPPYCHVADRPMARRRAAP